MEQRAIPHRVAVTRLKIADFRNYAHLDVAFGGTGVVFHGDNGAGKTNLLEALSLLSPGRGLRRSTYSDMARAGATSGFAIHARIEGPLGTSEIGTAAADGEQGEGARRIRIDGVNARSADDLLEWVRLIWLTPAMDGLFIGSAGDRRRFLDRLVLTIDPAHGRRALDYEKAMRGRNRLLTETRPDGRWLDAIEHELAEYGVALAAARIETLQLLSALTAAVPEESPFPRASLTLSGWPEDEVTARPSVEVEEAFRRKLVEGRARDAAAGRTLEGPHRSDLIVHHAAKAMPAALCSTGEQKALLIGIVLAHARLVANIAGFAPILLLDEIGAHLDERRRSALFTIIDDLNAQAFMTGTDATLFSALGGRAQFFRIAEGTITLQIPPDSGSSRP